MGGQEVGSVWGHGAYLAPDWTADWLHREAIYILNRWSKSEYGISYETLPSEKQAGLERRLQLELRKNTYNSKTGDIIVTPIRAEAIEYLNSYYAGLFMENPELDKLRNNYAIPKNAIKDAILMHQMTGFFFWATWACVTQRPDSEISYTHNWPPEELVGNKPTGNLLIWTGVSIILLLVGVGGMVFYHARLREDHTGNAR